MTIGGLIGSLILLVAAPAPSGRWVGQDGHDLVDKSPTPGASDVQDLHFVLSGLPARSKVVKGTVRGEGSGEWKFDGPPGSWLALAVKAPGASTADVYIEPYQVETGRTFEFRLEFDDGRSATIYVRGGKADPQLRMASARFQARWLGQDGRDLVPPGPNPGPDGVQDVHLALTRLAPKEDVRSILIAGPGDLRWRFGPNHEAFSRAEFVRDPRDPARADLCFHPTRDLDGRSLALTLTYASGKIDAATVLAGKCDPALKAKPPAATAATTFATKTRWLGQGGVGGRAGDVRVAIGGLPARGRIIGVDLSDGDVAGWSDRADGDIPDALPLDFRRGADPTAADLAFPPVRDESGATMTLRLLLDDGRSAVASFPGGPCDPALRAEAPAESSVVARPGDDLNDLANRYGAVSLAAGTYRLTRPLVLDRPVAIASEPGATIVFAQGPNEPAWTAAIKVRAGRTSLDHLAIRFEGPVRWDAGVSYGPAVIGATDDRDRATGRVIAGLRFNRLDVRCPPPSTAWEESPRTFRLVNATCGAIERCAIRGGMIEVRGGPWRVVENTFAGPPAGTFTYTMIGAHDPHDLLIARNTADPLDPRGKAWRWLVLTNRGSNVEVSDNTVRHVGPRDDDKVEHPNAPETILTESYRLNFEGKAAGVSPDGRVLSIPGPQGGPARVGSVVAILSGPMAGQWRRVALPLGPTAYLLDRPVALGGGAISIAQGFVGTRFERNTIDDRGGQVAEPFVLAGSHFGTRVVGNHTLGGARSARIVATGTEAPGAWGWSHDPMFGVVVEGNTFEDARGGLGLFVEHSPHVFASKGRVYATATLANNTFVASDASPKALALDIGQAPSADPGELVVTESGDRLRGTFPGVSSRVRMATVNGRAIAEGRLALPPEASSRR